MATAKTSSGLAYPYRFYAAASYAGFDGSPDTYGKGVSSRFSNDAVLLLYALYQKVNKIEETGERLLSALMSEKEELQSSLSKEKLQSLLLKQELTDAKTRNTDLYKELQSVHFQLAAEQSRCFKLEVDAAELCQKIQNMETSQKELELLHQRQKAASEQAALNANRQSSGGMWGWLARTPGQKADDV